MKHMILTAVVGIHERHSQGWVKDHLRERIEEFAPLTHLSVEELNATLSEPMPAPEATDKPMEERMKLQSAEFDAAEELMDAIRAHGLTPVVDDDYPEVRHRYESALKRFLAACKANGRTM